MPVFAEFAIKQEASPGTAETLTSAEADIRIKDGFEITPEVGLLDADEANTNSSKKVIPIGHRMVGLGIQYELRGPPDATTDPAVAPYWEASMFEMLTAYTLPIGSISNGPFLAGDIVTGQTSNATGMVLQETADGASTLPIIVLSGTFEAGGETVTATKGTTPASASASSGTTEAGRAFRPADWDPGDGTGHHVTAMLIRHGYQFTARGALASLRFPFRNGQPCRVEQVVTGPLESKGDKTHFNVISWPEAAQTPPRFWTAGLKFGSYSPSGVLDFDLAIQNTYEPVEDANLAATFYGLKYMDYVKDRPVITLDPDQVATGTYDYIGNFLGGGTFNLEWTLGSTTPKWTFTAPMAQFTEVGASIRSNRARFPLNIVCNGDNNNEILIWVR